MILRAYPSGQAHKRSGNGIADPDAEPGLPPRQTSSDHGGGNHPSIDVETVSDPEEDKVP